MSAQQQDKTDGHDEELCGHVEDGQGDVDPGRLLDPDDVDDHQDTTTMTPPMLLYGQVFNGGQNTAR